MKRVRFFAKDALYKPFLRFRNIFLELLIVFLGVYAAFLLSNYSENQKIGIQKKKVMKSLKRELEHMRVFYPIQSDYQRNVVDDWVKEFKATQKISAYYEWRFIQPQYNYVVLEYAINTREIGVINFDLHKELLIVYQELKKVEYAEESMNRMSESYHPFPDKSQEEAFQEAFRETRFYFSKFIRYANDRASILKRIAKDANKALKLVDQEFSHEELIHLEKTLIIDTFLMTDNRFTIDDVKEQVETNFPRLNQEDLQEIIKKIKETKDFE